MPTNRIEDLELATMRAEEKRLALLAKKIVNFCKESDDISSEDLIPALQVAILTSLLCARGDKTESVLKLFRTGLSYRILTESIQSLDKLITQALMEISSSEN